MDTQTIKKYLMGYFSKEELLKKYLPFMMIFFWSCLLFAWLLFPPELNYSIFERSISNLGAYQETPGAIFFSIGIMTFFFLLFPLFLYFHKRITKICKFTAGWGTFLGLTGCVFMFLVGIVSDDHADIFGMDQARLHVYLAALGILGVGFAMFTYYLPIFKDRFFKRGHKQFPFGIVTIAYGLILFAFTGMAIAELIKTQGDYGFPGPGFLSFTFWEWMLLFTYSVFIILACYFVPDEVQELKQK